MSDELEEEKDALDDDELQEDFGDDMPEDEELEGSEDGDCLLYTSDAADE